MKPVKYYYEWEGNRELEKQGFAELTLVAASDQSELTDMLVGESIKSQNKKAKIEVDFGATSLKIAKKNCLGIYDVTDPLTGDVIPKLTIEECYNNGVFRGLYEEINNAIGDINTLKEGIKKN